MSKQLCKQGLRKCKNCKKILPLNNDNFYKCKSNRRGFSYECKKCEKIRNKTRRETDKYKEGRQNYYNKTGRFKKNYRRLKLRFLILEKYNFTCQYCGRKIPEVILEVDHKYPRSKGGLDKIENYVVACRDCNLGKGDFILKEFN